MAVTISTMAWPRILSALLQSWKTFRRVSHAEGWAPRDDDMSAAQLPRALKCHNFRHVASRLSLEHVVMEGPLPNCNSCSRLRFRMRSKNVIFQYYVGPPGGMFDW
jgi:hypothetical protein